MFSIEIYIILCALLFSISIFYYAAKVKEINANFLKLIIPFGIICLFGIFFMNYHRYVLLKDSLHAIKIVLTFFSQLFLFVSIGIYLLSITYHDEDIINLNNPSLLKARKGEIEIGRVMYQNEKRHKFFLSLDDLEKHMFVCGSTGTGKSNFVQNFLINFKKKYDIPFLLIEFKGEYIFLQDIIEDVLVFKPGEDFSINIFNPEGAHPEIHAERIFDILKSGQFLDEETEYSPQMQKVLVDILTNVCKDKNSQNWKGFYEECKKYLRTERKKIPMLAQTLISIRNRIRRFSIGPLKAIFSSKTEFKIKDLLTKNIIIDLSSIIRLGGEKEDALFFLNMILKYLWDENLTKGGRNYEGIKHLTIVEDAQYFAPQDLTKQTKLTTYLEDIALLQRGTGECLISVATRPQVSQEILANCGVLVIFKSHMEKEFQCELLNLDEINHHYLAILEKGRCLIRVNSVKRPFLLWNPYIHRRKVSNREINKHNARILETFRQNENVSKNLEKMRSHPKEKVSQISPIPEVPPKESNRMRERNSVPKIKNPGENNPGSGKRVNKKRSANIPNQNKGERSKSSRNNHQSEHEITKEKANSSKAKKVKKSGEGKTTKPSKPKPKEKRKPSEMEHLKDIVEQLSLLEGKGKRK